MQAMEFSKGSGSALGLSLAPDSVDAFAQEFLLVKVALLDWRAKHGSRCETVLLTVVSAPENHAGIESLIDLMFQGEAELSPLLQAVTVQVALLNPRGKPVNEYAIGKSPAAPSPPARPWWRFW